MVTPAARRAWVGWVREAVQLPSAGACRATGVERSLMTNRPNKPPQTALRARLKELVAVRVRYGSPRLFALLRCEGWWVNHKRVEWPTGRRGSNYGGSARAGGTVPWRAGRGCWPRG